jgi:transposase
MAKLSSEERNKLPESAFAFPRQRKEPLVDAHHIQEALARFDQVDDVSNAERDEAWKRIQQAAKKFDIEVEEKDWRDLFKNSGRPLPKA